MRKNLLFLAAAVVLLWCGAPSHAAKQDAATKTTDGTKTPVQLGGKTLFYVALKQEDALGNQEPR